MLEERTGCRAVPEHLADDRQVDHLEPGATVAFRDDCPEDSELGKRGPKICAHSVLALEDLAHSRKGEVVREEAEQSLSEETLVFVEVEVHRAPTIAGSRGRPYPRSAMMLRWM